MKIEIIKCLNDNYSYLIFEDETNTVSIVDPSEFISCDKVIPTDAFFTLKHTRDNCKIGRIFKPCFSF